MNTSAKGDLSVAKVTAALLSRGASISIPWGNSLRYDLILDIRGKLITIQVKTARRMKNNTIEFKSHSQRRDKSMMPYLGQVDVFAVYYPHNDQIYVLPVSECPGTATILRLEAPRNNQLRKIRDAALYHIDRWWEGMVSGTGLEPVTSTVSTWRSNQTELTGQVQ